MSRRGPALVYLLVVVLGALYVGVPFLTRDRPQVTSVPIARPTHAFGPVAVGHEPVCVEGVELGPDASAVAIQALAAGPPIAVEVTGPGGYRATGAVPGGYPAETQFTVPFRPSSRELADGRVCLRAVGSETAQLLGGTTDRELGSARTTIGGQPAPTQLSLALRDVPAKGLLERLGQLADRAAAVRPFPAVGWLLVLLGVITVVGVPVLMFAALASRHSRS